MRKINYDICHYCGQPTTPLTKLLEDKGRSQTIIYICENPSCPLRVNHKKLRTWVK